MFKMLKIKISLTQKRLDRLSSNVTHWSSGDSCNLGKTIMKIDAHLFQFKFKFFWKKNFEKLELKCFLKISWIIFEL